MQSRTSAAIPQFAQRKKVNPHQGQTGRSDLGALIKLFIIGILSVRGIVHFPSKVSTTFDGK
jgi:hypothetical protein